MRRRISARRAGGTRFYEANNTAEFESALSRFGTFETRAEYAIWALAIGDSATAGRLQDEIDRITPRWNALTRELNEPVMRRLRAAQALAREGR